MTPVTRPQRANIGHPDTPVRARRPNTPLAVVGALVVICCALAFAVSWSRAGHRQPVLVLAHAVPAGQVITAADVRVVRVSVDGPVNLVPVSREASVLGHPAAASLPAGSLLTSAAASPAADPAGGQASLGVAVKPGQYPPDLAAGQSVEVLAAPAAGSGPQGSPGAAGTAPALPVGHAVVVAVDAQASADGLTVVELRVTQDAVPQVAAAAAAGQLSLATTPAGG